MRRKQAFRIATGVVVIAVGLTAFVLRDRWLPLIQDNAVVAESAPKGAESPAASAKIILTDQAIANLRLTAKPVRPQTYWKSIQVPGMV